eukprot:snap_masked-scaffold_19-processed-gene-2.30-mRNA-1 protein AED:1.00 eAED:1.00 QI:0/0/0/0/1/1/2/0/264
MKRVFLDRRFQFNVLRTSYSTEISNKEPYISYNGVNELKQIDPSQISSLVFYMYRLDASKYYLSILKQEIKRFEVREIKFYIYMKIKTVNMKYFKAFLNATVGACDKITLTLFCDKPDQNLILNQIQRFQNITSLDLNEFRGRGKFEISFWSGILIGGSTIDKLYLSNSKIFLPLCRALKENEAVRNLRKIEISYYPKKHLIPLLNTLNVMKFSSLTSIDIEFHVFTMLDNIFIPFSLVHGVFSNEIRVNVPFAKYPVLRYLAS